MRDPLNNLEHIKVRGLSGGERTRMWAGINTKLSTTPVVSPWSFMSRKAVVMVAVFLVIFGTVGAADSARPGSTLFPVDLAVERIESAVDPASRADHARERVEEFQLAFAVPTDDMAANEMRMQKNAPAPGAETATFMAAMDADMAEETQELPPELQEAIEKTRNELMKLHAEATLKGNAETLQQIQLVIDEFEAYVASL